MERTLRKACRYGDMAKFWGFISKISTKVLTFAEAKKAKNLQTQFIMLKSVGFNSIEEFEQKMIEVQKTEA